MRSSVPERWENQEEAMRFAMQRPSVMLDMGMGTGKTRTAIDIMFARKDVYRVLVVCPKAVVGVWRENLGKFAPKSDWQCWDETKGSVKSKAESLRAWLPTHPGTMQVVVVNYDVVWRGEMGNLILKCGFQMVILDESHRAKAAGSKVSKYLAMLGKRTRYKMCLSGTPMANSPLDVYGQYRFLDPTIFGTNHNQFLQEYAIMGGPEKRFVIGYKNQKQLNEKFRSIAYSCKLSDIADRIKLPPSLPPVTRSVTLPAADMRTSKILAKEFVSECGSGNVVVNSVLAKMIRLQQITSGFCSVVQNPGEDPVVEDINTAKEDELLDILSDVPSEASVVVFCVFTHDLDSVARAASKAKRRCFELSGRADTLEEWKKAPGAVIAVQIQAGAEGVDMTKAQYAVYFSLPKSLALYNQSMARLYRPGQTGPVLFMHLIARNTIDEAMYASLLRKKDIVEAIKDGSFDLGFIK